MKLREVKMKNVQAMKDILYRMKQNYGAPATYIKILNDSTDSVTGQRTVQRDILFLKKVVELPEDVVRKYWYDIAFIKANTNFTYGAEVDIISKQVIIDVKDLKGHVIEQRDFIIINHERFHIEKIYLLEQNVGYLLSLKAAKGVSPYDVISLKVEQSLQMYGVAIND
jgi:hypothetical protein